MQRTLKRELKVPEIVKREALGTSPLWFPVGCRLVCITAVHFDQCTSQRRLGRSRDEPAEGEPA
jgi:hypothetical protein